MKGRKRVTVRESEAEAEYQGLKAELLRSARNSAPDLVNGQPVRDLFRGVSGTDKPPRPERDKPIKRRSPKATAGQVVRLCCKCLETTGERRPVKPPSHVLCAEHFAELNAQMQALRPK